MEDNRESIRIPGAKPPTVFGIGLPHSGGRTLAALFAGNGFAWQQYAGGKLAVDLAYARSTNALPLGAWPKAVGFSGLYRGDKRHLPDLRVQHIIVYLKQRFPDAYFIHTRRDPADWIAARFLAEDGAHRAAAGWHAGVSVADLPDYWLAEQAAHAQACAALFDNKDRFIDFNVTTEPIENLCDFLAPGCCLSANVELPDIIVPATTLRSVTEQISAIRPIPALCEIDLNFARQVADFSKQSQGTGGTARALNAKAVHWQADDNFTDRHTAPAPILQKPEATVLIAPSSGLERAQGTLTELIAHGAKPPLFIDMMDARFLGTPGHRAAPRDTVVYNRRKGAKNLTLWPLPGYHTLAPTGHAGGFPLDDIAFADKADRCVWLGNITGRMSLVLTPEGRELRGVYNIRDQMIGLPDDAPEWADIIADLSCVPRYNIVKTLRGEPDFTVGLVLRDKWKRLAKSPAFAGLCTPMQNRRFFHQYRYILSLAGNDTGSNFLSAAASNALILKEEDGWELFYTDAFKPWVHYVPLTEGAQDAVEKLDWARAHPSQSAKMASASRDLFDKFANADNRAAFLHAIAAHLNAAS